MSWQPGVPRTGPEHDGPSTDRDSVLDDSEPAALGAAPTLSGERVKRSHKATSNGSGRSREASDDASATAVEVGSPPGDDSVVYVFEPHTARMPALRPYLRSLWERRRFMVALARADIRGAHSSTALGSLWGLADPIFQAAIYLFLFTVIRGGRGRPEEFVPVLLAGIFLFRLTSNAINEGGRSIRNSKDLMLLSSFPRALLPLTAVYKGLLNFVPTIFVFAPVYIIFGVPPHRSLVLLPALFAIQAVMNVGAALLVSTAVVFVKDTQNALSYISRVLFFMTPVIYPVALIPAEIHDVLAFLPLFPLFATYQAVIGGTAVDQCARAAGGGLGRRVRRTRWLPLPPARASDGVTPMSDTDAVRSGGPPCS